MESFSSESSYNAFGSEASISEQSPQQFRGSKVTNVKCRYFMNNGYCFYGEACQFVHAAPTVNGGEQHSPTSQQQQQPTSEFYSSTSEGKIS